MNDPRTHTVLPSPTSSSPWNHERTSSPRPAATRSCATSLHWNSLEELLYTTLDYKGNRDRMTRLIELADKGLVIPFVGAGLSVSCGIPTWAAFIVSVRAHLNAHSAQFEEAVKTNDLETAADLAAEDMGDALFRERVQARLDGSGDSALRGPLLLLPERFDGPVITTNLDHFVERAYDSAGLHFEDIVRHDVPPGVEGLLAQRRRILIKVHGDQLYPEEWVLREAQYDTRYGPRRAPQMSLPLPRALGSAFRTSPVLFVGCSLLQDRTLDVLEHVCNTGAGRAPDHFAILEAPPNDDEWDTREIALSQLNIFPIWFPAGEFDAVEAVLLGLPRIF